MNITREEFEEFLNTHGEDILDRMDQTPRPLAKWLAVFVKSITAAAAEHHEETDDDAANSVFDDEDNGGLFADDDEG